MRSNEFDKKIAENIIVFRNSLGLSQREFAIKAGIEPNHLNKIEKFNMSLSFNNLQKISESYDICPSVFFKFSEKDKEQEQVMMLVKGIKEKWKLDLIATMIKKLYFIKK